jgi:glycosyltransferase involved in cell wall biosynthesis
MDYPNLPFITICMPVRNEERYIERTLQELLNQDYPKERYEIIVADGESEDRTKEIVNNLSVKNSNVILMNNPRRLSSAGRNMGFKKGRGDIFLVIDGHCWIGHDQLLKNIVNCFEKSGAQCLGRPQPLDPPDIIDFQKAVALARASRIGHGGDSLIYSDYEGYVSPVSHGAVYKREIFEKIGYVDETFDACEDLEFNYRVEKAGFKAYMNPSLTIKYYPRENLLGLFKQMVRYGYGRFKMFKKHPETLTFNGIIPVFFVIGLIILPILGFFYHVFWWIFISVYGAYLLIILLVAWPIAEKENLKFLMPIFFIIHFGLGWGLIRGLFSLS